MKKQKGFTIIELIVAIVVMLIIPMFIGWGINISKLTDLDFKAPYKAEAIRVIGILPPVGGIVGFMDIEDK